MCSNGKNRALEVRQFEVHVLASPFLSCVALGEILNLSGPQFPLLWKTLRVLACRIIGTTIWGNLGKSTLEILAVLIPILAITERIQAILISDKSHAGDTVKILWDCLRVAKNSPFLLKLFIVRSCSGQACLSSLPYWQGGGPRALSLRCSLWFLSALALVVCFIQTRCQGDDVVQGAKEQTGYLGTVLVCDTSKSDTVSQWYREKKTLHPFEGGGN